MTSSPPATGYEHVALLLGLHGTDFVWHCQLPGPQPQDTAKKRRKTAHKGLTITATSYQVGRQVSWGSSSTVGKCAVSALAQKKGFGTPICAILTPGNSEAGPSRHHKSSACDMHHLPPPCPMLPAPAPRRPQVAQSRRCVRRAAGSLFAMPVTKRPVRRRLRSVCSQAGSVVRAWKGSERLSGNMTWQKSRFVR